MSYRLPEKKSSTLRALILAPEEWCVGECVNEREKERKRKKEKEREIDNRLWSSPEVQGEKVSFCSQKSIQYLKVSISKGRGSTLWCYFGGFFWWWWISFNIANSCGFFQCNCLPHFQSPTVC
jgi:hypothetical protein